MEGYHLDWWTDRLKPLCDAFIETAKGAPSKGFWQHIYKPKEIYGGKVITGWMADLFAYVEDPITHDPAVRNPILETPRHELLVEHGLQPRMLPTGLSCAPVVLEMADLPTGRVVDLVGGFLGVMQDGTGNVKPEIGWAVVERDDVSRLVEKLMPSQGNSVHPDQRESTLSSMGGLNGVPRELIQILDKAGADRTFLQTPSTHGG